MTERERAVAESIAKALFANSLGERADRLAQLLDGHPIGGGWSLTGAIEMICEVLHTEGWIIERVVKAEQAERRYKEFRR